MLGRKQPEDDIDRHGVGGIEHHRRFQTKKRRDRTGDPGDPGVGNGDGAPESGAAKLLALFDFGQHYGCIQTINHGKPVGEQAQDCRLGFCTHSRDGFGKKSE